MEGLGKGQGELGRERQGWSRSANSLGKSVDFLTWQELEGMGSKLGE